MEEWQEASPLAGSRALAVAFMAAEVSEAEVSEAEASTEEAAVTAEAVGGNSVQLPNETDDTEKESCAQTI
jgi:hypothetical protein